MRYHVVEVWVKRTRAERKGEGYASQAWHRIRIASQYPWHFCGSRTRSEIFPSHIAKRSANEFVGVSYRNAGNNCYNPCLINSRAPNR
jgi:hypothetical protein